MGDISAFVGSIGKQRLAKKTRYKIQIKGPGNKDADPIINLMCESISFAGQNVRSVPDTLRYGPAREHAQGMTYGPFTATFICSSDMLEKQYFEWWQSQVINLDTWEVKYYDHYKGSLKITQLDEANTPTYSIDVKEAYPKTILPQDVGYAQSNAYQTIGVEFTYRFWKGSDLPETGNVIPVANTAAVEKAVYDASKQTMKRAVSPQGNTTVSVERTSHSESYTYTKDPPKPGDQGYEMWKAMGN